MQPLRVNSGAWLLLRQSIQATALAVLNYATANRDRLPPLTYPLPGRGGRVTWRVALSLRVDTLRVNAGNANGIYSFHPGGVNMSQFDASVAFISMEIDEEVLASEVGTI